MAGNIWSKMFKSDFRKEEPKLSRTEAIIPSTGNATTGDTHEKLPSAIVQMEEIAASDESLQYLSENIGKNWRTVGRKLKLTDGQLDILDIDYCSNHQEKVYQMLLVWKRGTAATYDVLADALKSAQRADLCREITRNTFEQDVVKNLKEMKEESNKVRDTQTCLSNRREFEEGGGHHGQRMPAQHISTLPRSTPLQRYTAVQYPHSMNKESSLSRTEATIPSMGNATATHEELPSAIVQTKDSAVSKESLQDLSVELSQCWMEVGMKLQLTEGQLESLDEKSYVTLREKTYQMLLMWKRKVGSAATYDVLGDALQKAGRVDLKEYLLRTYKPT